MAQARILNNQFTSAFTREDLSSIPVPTQVFDPESGPPLESVDITAEMVKNKIDVLKPGASGPDKISPRLLRELSAQLCLPISIVFNKSLREGTVPKDWKLSNVTSIYKKGDKTVAANYRPISLTCMICRIMESILRDRILLHLQEYHLINRSQHGFLPHLSCLTNLLEFLEEITKLIDEGHSIDVLFLDFSKAFDKVPHARLISKIKAHGIVGNITDWIQDWLFDRKQRVVLNGKVSDWTNVLSGVPQGSVLGPILFLIYINDIDDAIDCVTTFVKKFADDTKLATVTDNVSQCASLQEQIDSLLRWAEIWQMSFNFDKCVVMHLGAKNIRHTYHMNDFELKTTECEKDIGIYMQPSLKPSFHVAESVKKANKALGILLRCLTYRDKHHYIRLYKTYVRCHLEYAVQAWSPWTKQDIDNIEAVQKRAIRNCHGLHGSNYEEKLKEVGLTTLVDRRRRGDLLETFKILNRYDDVDYRTWFKKVNDQHQMTRQAVVVSEDGTVVGGTDKLSKPTSRLEVRKQFFSCRVVDGWNNLPDDVRGAVSVDDFKVKYDKFMAGE